MRAVLFSIVLLPTPALAGFDCTLQTMCTLSGCETAEALSALVQEVGTDWTLSVPDTPTMTGSAIAGGAEANRVTLAFPPQTVGFDTVSGLLDIYPTGQMVLTVHLDGTGGALDMTGSFATYTGLCAGEGA